MTLYVSPTGSSTGPGTESSPYLTIGQAAAHLPNGGEVWLTPGTYPAEQLVNVRPTATITVHVPLGAKHGGLDFRGTRDFTIDGDHMRGVVGSFNLDKSTGALAGGSGRITVQGVDTSGVRFVNRAFELSVRDSYIHDGSGNGIGAPGRATTDATTGQSPDRSRDIVIDGNLIERFSQDAVQISDVLNLTFTGNTVRDVRDPRSETGECVGAGQPNPLGLPECTHNDGFQIPGGVTNALIARNHFSRITTQTMIIQGNTPAVPRKTDGVIVRENVALDSGTALQVNSVLGLVVERNVLMARTSGLTYDSGFGIVPTDGVIHNNVLSSLRIAGGAQAEVTDNVIVS